MDSIITVSVLSFIISFLLCLSLCLFFKRKTEKILCRRKINVVEYPRWRKADKDLAPLGGAAIIISVSVVCLCGIIICNIGTFDYLFAFIVSLLFAFIAFFKDLTTLTQNRKFNLPNTFSFVCRLVLSFAFSLYLYNMGKGYVPLLLVGDYFDFGLFYIPVATVVIFFFSVSSEMTDNISGINALTSVPVFSFICVYMLCRQSVGDIEGVLLSFSVLGAVFGFLILGRPNGLLLQGHAGTSFCGTLAVLLCFLLNIPTAIFIVGFVWLIQGISFLLTYIPYKVTRGKHRLLSVAPLDAYLRNKGVSENTVLFSYFAVGVLFAAMAYILVGGK